MFRIVFQCDDRKLADALRGLTGIAIGSPEVQPVVNAAVKNGKVIANGTGDMADLFTKFAKTKHLDKFTAPEMREFCTSIGRNPTSATYFANQLVKKGVVKKQHSGKGNKSVYYLLAVKS